VLLLARTSTDVSILQHTTAVLLGAASDQCSAAARSVIGLYDLQVTLACSSRWLACSPQDGLLAPQDGLLAPQNCLLTRVIGRYDLQRGVGASDELASLFAAHLPRDAPGSSSSSAVQVRTVLVFSPGVAPDDASGSALAACSDISPAAALPRAAAAAAVLRRGASAGGGVLPRMGAGAGAGEETLIYWRRSVVDPTLSSLLPCYDPLTELALEQARSSAAVQLKDRRRSHVVGTHCRCAAAAAAAWGQSADCACKRAMLSSLDERAFCSEQVLLLKMACLHLKMSCLLLKMACLLLKIACSSLDERAFYSEQRPELAPVRLLAERARVLCSADAGAGSSELQRFGRRLSAVLGTTGIPAVRSLCTSLLLILQ